MDDVPLLSVASFKTRHGRHVLICERMNKAYGMQSLFFVIVFLLEMTASLCEILANPGNHSLLWRGLNLVWCLLYTIKTSGLLSACEVFHDTVSHQ